jgi:hypothetical protein
VANYSSEGVSRTVPLQNKLFAAVLVAVGVMGAQLAHADLLRTFDVSGSFQDGSSLGGTVTIDVTSGAITAAALDLGAPISVSITNGSYGSTAFSGGVIAALYAATIPNSAAQLANDKLYLDFATPSLVGYSGGAFYSTTDPAAVTNGKPYGTEIHDQFGIIQTQLVSGAATAATAVPEPSGLATLAAGLFGLGLVARRKQRHI